MAADRTAYAVFLHPQAIEALGPAITPYLSDSPAGPHLACAEIDSGGALFEMTLVGTDPQGHPVEVDLMIPTNMVKLVVSIRRDEDFGFGVRETPVAVPVTVAAPATEPASAPPPTPPPSTAAPGAAAT
jgi:hypothetical protein